MNLLSHFTSPPAAPPSPPSVRAERSRCCWISHRAQTPAPATEDPVSPDRQDVRGAGNARPQYTTITRERPTAPAQAEQASEPRESDATTGGREYVTIERQRPATQRRPTQQESETKEVDPSTGGREYVTIERQRPTAQRRPAQQESETRETDPSTGGLEYVVIERARPATSSRVTPATEALFPAEPTLEYVTITRSRVSPTATLPLSSGTEATVSAAEGLEGRAPSTPRYQLDCDKQSCHAGPRDAALFWLYFICFLSFIVAMFQQVTSVGLSGGA